LAGRGTFLMPIGLITNNEVLVLDQDAPSKPAVRVSQQGEPTGRTEVWVRELKDGSRAAGLFNRGETMAEVTLNWEEANTTTLQKLKKG
jgi:alpha-galactosidase